MGLFGITADERSNVSPIMRPALRLWPFRTERRVPSTLLLARTSTWHAADPIAATRMVLADASRTRYT